MNKNIYISEKPSFWQLFQLITSIYILIIILVEHLTTLDQEAIKIINFSDNVVCFLFFIDFVYHLRKAKDKKEYLKWGWLDLISCIPSVSFLMIGRYSRILRLFHIARVIISFRYITREFLNSTTKSAAFITCVLFLIILSSSSFLILLFEQSAAGSTIKTAEDAIWWACTTMSTVGYGDCYPVTGAGRFVGIVLIFTGVGIFGTLAACLASFLQKKPQQKEKQLDNAILRELEVLKQQIKELSEAKENR